MKLISNLNMLLAFISESSRPGLAASTALDVHSVWRHIVLDTERFKVCYNRSDVSYYTTMFPDAKLVWHHRWGIDNDIISNKHGGE